MSKRVKHKTVVHVVQDPAPPPQQLMVSSSQAYSGPIPPPALLREFNDILPNGADRIFQMAEEAANHRHKLESEVIASDISRAKLGLIFGLSIVVLAILTGGLVAAFAHAWAGAFIAATPSAAMIGIFVYGSSAKSKERIEKAKIMTGQTDQKATSRKK